MESGTPQSQHLRITQMQPKRMIVARCSSPQFLKRFLTFIEDGVSDLIRLATGGTGVLPEGNIPHDLVNRLARKRVRQPITF